MAFKVKIRDTRFVGSRIEEFYKCDKKPAVYCIDEVKWFQASGEEYKVIRAQFDHIAVSLYDECTWHGEMAQFIFQNLKLPTIHTSRL